MYTVDLNCDLGEGFGAYKIGNDEAIIPLISSANVACGAHAGDPTVMKRTVALCKEAGVSVGAHPGFFDLQGFGRRNMSLSPDEVKALMTYQIGALDGFCRSAGIPLRHVKPHGALYNMAAKDDALARAVCEAVYEYGKDLILMGLSGSRMSVQAKAMGLPFGAEVFADRAYEDDGSLVARSKPNAMIKDENEAVKRLVGMIKDKKVRSVNGNLIDVDPHSVCVHGDSEKALVFVERIREAFAREGIRVAPLCEVIR